MNEREHLLDDSPLTKEKVAELKKSANELLRDLETANESKDVQKSATAPV